MQIFSYSIVIFPSSPSSVVDMQQLFIKVFAVKYSRLQLGSQLQSRVICSPPSGAFRAFFELLSLR